MKATYKISQNLSIELEGSKLVDLLQQISDVENAIAPEPCGKCKGNNVFPRVRKVKDDIFYELQCKEPNCWAVLQLGINKNEENTLYKKRMKTDSKGKAVRENDKPVYLPDRGWLKWDKETKRMI